MTRLKTLIFMLSMLLATTGTMAQFKPPSKPTTVSPSTSGSSGNRSGTSNRSRSGNQNRTNNQNRSGSQSRSGSQNRSFKPLCPDGNHPHMIDLGLPSGTKWACCNVGARKPEDYGGYFAWGETQTKSNYSKDTYIYFKNDLYQDIGSDIAGTQYDVAHVKWGGSWVMPSYDQIKELLDNCTYQWTTVNGVKGGKFTSKKNGASVFLPAAGYRWDGGLGNAGSYGPYWSSTQDPSGSDFAYYLGFDSGRAYWGHGGRLHGFSVRPVSR